MNIEILTEQILQKMPNISKCRKQFLVHLFSVFMIVRGRYNFENISRYGGLDEGIYRNWFGKPFDFMEFNLTLLSILEKEERIIVFDPSYLPKSGNKTVGTGYYWSGCAGSTKYGLEIGGFASVGLETQTALHLKAVQTIKDKSVSFFEFYAEQMRLEEKELKKVSSIAVFDAFFSREPFVSSITTLGFTMISKFAKNTVLMYPYLGERSGKPGRPKKYETKVDKTGLLETVDKVRDVTKSFDEGVMTTLTSEPFLINSLTISGDLYAAIPPEIPIKIFFPIRKLIFKN